MSKQKVKRTAAQRAELLEKNPLLYTRSVARVVAVLNCVSKVLIALIAGLAFYLTK